MANTFLRAEWRKLIMANYKVDPEILLPYLPYKTEFDLWNKDCYVSLIGFLFKNVRIKGIAFPFHTTFEEANLRFYVRYKSGEQWKRGVVFIKEIVPKPMVSIIANTLYREKYETMPMGHKWNLSSDHLDISYSWKKKRWHSLGVKALNQPERIQQGSIEEFITEHYWGYARYADKVTNEYEVTHPKWDVYPVKEHHIDVNFKALYGTNFSFLNNSKPVSILLAEGSEISIKAGSKIT